MTTEAETAQQTLNADEVAAILRCHRRTVLSMAAEKVIPSCRAGVGPRAPVRVPRAAIEAFLAGGCPWAAAGQPKPTKE